MSYLLDSNACIALINDRSARVRARFDEATAAGDGVGISSIVLFELWYGIAKSARRAANTETLRRFLAGPVEVLDFGPDDAEETALIRAGLEARGTPIGAYDTVIAGHARRRGLTLVTANKSEFSRVPDLQWEDWGS